MKLNVVYNKSSQRMDELPDGSIDCTMTSPPYWGLRDYGVDGQLGLEPTFQLYLDHMLEVCAEVKRVLKGTGSFWLNMGDTYSATRWSNTPSSTGISGRASDVVLKKEISLPDKCLVGIPWRLALRLVDEQGWILRNAIIWNKPNHMPSSVKDRCSNGYEFLFHLVKQKKYYYDLDAIREPHRGGRELRGGSMSGIGGPRSKKLPKNGLYGSPLGKNPGDVWTIPTQPRPEAHFATFPDRLCEKPIKATCPQEICRKCGKARVRKLCRDKKIQQHWAPQKKIKIAQGAHGKTSVMETGFSFSYKTIGWTDCGCNAGFEPGIVLDPFAGRGTALIMAKKLGRYYVGYELKKEYCEKLVEPALSDIDPLFSQ